MPHARKGTNERAALPFEQRRLPSTSRGATDWLDEVTADVCGARALTILLHAMVHDANPHAIATTRQLHQALADA